MSDGVHDGDVDELVNVLLRLIPFATTGVFVDAFREGLMPYRRALIERDVNASLVREILEALCRRDGLSFESSLEPGSQARNYDLALRLGIIEVFGLTPTVIWRERPADGLAPDGGFTGVDV